MKKSSFLLLLPALALLSSCTITIYKQNYYTTDGTQQTGGNTTGGNTQDGGNTTGGNTQDGGNTTGGGTTTGGGQTEGSGYGTESAPLTVTQALNLVASECPEDKGLTQQALYVKGSISEIKTADFEYDDGPCAELYVTDGTQTAYVYRVHYTAAQKSKIAVGTTITFCGYGKNFKGTLEFCDNGAANPCTLVG